MIICSQFSKASNTIIFVKSLKFMEIHAYIKTRK